MLIKLKMLIELFILPMVTCLNLAQRKLHKKETVLTDEATEQFLVEINSYHCSDEVLDEFIKGKTKPASTNLAWAKYVP